MGATPTKETILSSVGWPLASSTSIFSLVPVFPPMEKPATWAFFAVPSVTTDSIRLHMVWEVSAEMVLRSTVGSCFSTVFPLASNTSETIKGSIRSPPLTTEEIARTSCKGVSLKVCPKEPEVREAVPHFSVFTINSLEKNTPLLSPDRSMPVFSVTPNR